MTQPPVQPSGSDVSQVESDIQQTIDLAGTLVTLIREPISLIYQNVVKARNLKRSLGVWQEQMLDGDGYCSTPVLRLKEFEEYLVEIDGVIPASITPQQVQNTGRASWSWTPKPMRSSSSSPSPSPWPTSGPRPTLPSAGTACWAYFLFAIGIHPGTKVGISLDRRGMVNRKPSTDGFIDIQNGGIEMEIDGAVLCHIFNLYSEDLSGSETGCIFRFGRIGCDVHGAGGQLHAHFSPGVENELACKKYPFEMFGVLTDGKIMTSYYNAVHHGASDSRYQLADPRAPLAERLNKLVDCFEMLNNREDELRKGKTHDLLLLSHEWFEYASSVKRRVLTQGGKDHAFFKDISKLCRADEERIGLKRFFLFQKDKIVVNQHLFGVLRTSSIEPPPLPAKAVQDVLSSYEVCKAGSWKRTLFDMKEDVLRALQIPNTVTIDCRKLRMKVLQFTPNSNLWNRTVLLGAPTSV